MSLPGLSRPALESSGFGPSALSTPANALTVARMLLALPLLAFVATGGASYPALIAWIVLAATDGFDGYLAHRHGTTRSRVFPPPPLADEVLVLGAAWALVAPGTFWRPPVVLITVRELGISLFWSSTPAAVSPSPPAARPRPRPSSRKWPSAWPCARCSRPTPPWTPSNSRYQ